MLSLLKKLGNPHLRLPPIVHIAGTNGKGSTLAFLRAMLEASQKKVHMYTSPHLITVHERIVLVGHPIEEAYLNALLARCQKEATQETGWFHLMTVAAFLAFSETPADILLLETGIGGRLDATNVVEAPVLTGITSLSLDHTESLGPTLAHIAQEKAGILKPGCPLVTCAHSPEASAVLRQRSQSLNCPLFAQGEVWDIAPLAQDAPLTFRWNQQAFTFPKPGLLGLHQRQNAGIALACGMLLGLSPPALGEGLTKVSWPGRLQRLTSQKGLDIWIDGAHNPGGAQALLEMLLFWQKEDPRPLYMIAGMLPHKDQEAFLQTFQNHVEHLCIVPIPGEASASSHFYEKARELAFSVALCSSLQDALQDIEHLTQEKPAARVVICGSLYLVGEALSSLS